MDEINYAVGINGISRSAPWNNNYIAESLVQLIKLRALHKRALALNAAQTDRQIDRKKGDHRERREATKRAVDTVECDIWNWFLIICIVVYCWRWRRQQTK